MKKFLILLSIFFTMVLMCHAGETYVSCNIQACLHINGITGEPLSINRYFYINSTTKKVYDKSHKLLVSEYENGVYTIHFREADRTERLIYDTKTKQVTLYGKQRRGYYYPWVLYNGFGTGSSTNK
ncbi:MAG: hypothetical protein NC200_07890 [Candidatus Gastranaerophilales bacterium]|nr:hypothetical protein [Candidatus Gastranaerophilales bacterium]